jgi:hypothetical protein
MHGGDYDSALPPLGAADVAYVGDGGSREVVVRRLSPTVRCVDWPSVKIG